MAVIWYCLCHSRTGLEFQLLRIRAICLSGGIEAPVSDIDWARARRARVLALYRAPLNHFCIMPDDFWGEGVRM